MLLEADWVLPIAGPPIAGGALLVTHGSIAAVGQADELRARYPGVPVRSFPGSALLPGFVNTHTHLEYSAFLDFAPPSEFGEWMLSFLRARRKLDPEDYEVSALWGACECVRCGVTTIADASFAGGTTVRAASATGLRARVYLEVFGREDAEAPAVMDQLDGRLAGLEDRPAAPGGRGGPSVEAGLSPHAPYTVSTLLYREVARYARRRGLRLATHLAESAAEVELLEKGTGAIAWAYRAADLWRGRRWKPPRKSPIAVVAEAGALGPSTLAVHCVQAGDADIAVLAETRTPVAHCPRSNLRLRCGSAPVAELLRAGVTVALGTDSLASNESLDMFAEMRGAQAAWAARARGAEVTEGGMSETDVLRMATLEGARALGWEHSVGSLETGKRADVIAVHLPDSTPVAAGHSSGPDPVAALVCGATAADVLMTMVDGRVVFDHESGRATGPLAEDDFEKLERAWNVARAKLGRAQGRDN